MDRREPDVIPKTYYNSMVLLCFLACAGLCCAVLQALPSSCHNDDCGKHGDLTYAFIRMALSTANLLLTVCVGWLIKNRANFHRRQEVFWPMQCRHCAQVVGLESADTSSSVLKDDERAQFQQRSISRRWSFPTNLESLKRYVTVNNSPATSADHHQDTPMTAPTSHEQNNETILRARKQIFYKPPHKSLLLIFIIFGSVVLIETPLQIFGIFICLTNSGQSVSTKITLVAQAVFDLSTITAFLMSLFFFNIYYDAVIMVKAKFSISLSIYLALSIAIAALKIGYPISADIATVYDPLKDSCDMKRSLKQFLIDLDDTMESVYTKLAVTAVGILWNIWLTMVPQCFLDITSSPPEFDYFHTINRRPLSKRILNSLKNSYLKIKLRFWRTSSDNEWYLLQHTTTSHQRFSYQRTILIPATFFSAIYFTFHVYVSYGDWPNSKSTRTYIGWVLRMAFYIPFIGLYHFQIFLSGRSKTILLKNPITVSSGLIQSHDIVLLLSGGGIFMLNIFRLVAAMGILMRFATRAQDEIALAAFSIVYAVFQFYIVWTMTSFLLIIQRRKFTSDAEVKWVLICLIYTFVANACNWLIGLFNVSSWIELELYYGSIGKVIGGSVEPIISLYGLHAAMIAYGTYHDIQKGYVR